MVHVRYVDRRYNLYLTGTLIGRESDKKEGFKND